MSDNVKRIKNALIRNLHVAKAVALMMGGSPDHRDVLRTEIARELEAAARLEEK